MATATETVSQAIIPTLCLGPTVRLCKLEDLQAMFPGHDPQQIRKILRTLGVPLIHTRDSAFFNLNTLESVLCFLLGPAGTGIALPLSKEKYRPNSIYTHKTRVTPDDLSAIAQQELVDTETARRISDHLESLALDATPAPTTFSAFHTPPHAPPVDPNGLGPESDESEVLDA